MPPMPWPLSQDYNEALQNPQTSFSDPELRQGQVVTNALGLPMPCSGNFADVYQVRCPDGTRWAVKCFTRESPGLRERYQEIGRHLRQAVLPFTVDFNYLEQGVRIHGRWYPVLKMQWVEGFTLNEFVRANLDRPATLEALFQIWLWMARRLREARIAHADLQHGNVLLVPGSRPESLALKLIDYDGLWVPALAEKKSGEVGHPAYQHPQRLREGTYNAEVDRFPLLAVATALRGLKTGGRALWERYDNGDNLLFREGDFKTPGQSPLIRELGQLVDPGARSLVEPLLRSCKGAIDRVPLLDEVLEGLTTAAPATEPIRQNTSRPPLVLATTAVEPLARKHSAVPASEVVEAWQEAEEEPEERPRRRPRSRVVSVRRKNGMAPWVWLAIGAAGMLGVVVLGAVGFLALRGLARMNQQAGLGSTPVSPQKELEHGLPDVGAPKAQPGDRPPPPHGQDNAIEKKQPPPGNQVTRQKLPDTRLIRYDGRDVGEILRLQVPGGAAGHLGLSSDGRWLLCSWAPAFLCEFDPAKEEIRLACSFGDRQNQQTAVFAPDGKTVYVASQDGHLRRFLVPSGEELWHLEIEKSANGYSRLFCTGDGKRLLPFDQMFTPYFLNVTTGTKERILNEGHFMVAALAPDDDNFLFSNFNDVACLWSVKAKRELLKLRGHNGRVRSLTFSSDGKHALTGDQGGTIRLWDVRDGRELRAFRGHSGAVESVALSPDGRRALSADASRLIILWDTQNGKELYRLEGFNAIFTKDGAHAISGDVFGFRLWRLPAG
jgi:hypothetical protein